MNENNEALLKEYQAEMERHHKAIQDIMNKYIPNYEKEYDRR